MTRDFNCVPYCQNKSLPSGFIHPRRSRCPFHGRRVNRLGCCWLKAGDIAEELRALGEYDLAERMQRNMSPSTAMKLAASLAKTAHVLERRYRRRRQKPNGAWFGPRFDPMEKRIIPGKISTFEEAIATIQRAATWFRTVGKAGCSVEIDY
jgi:hypothetical protein